MEGPLYVIYSSLHMTLARTNCAVLAMIGRFLIGASFVSAVLPSLHAQGTAAIGREIPAEALSRSHAFVIAHDGESYLYNFTAGVVKAPFLHNMYKPFGFSFDSRYFAYLKSNGRFPTFDLYCLDLSSYEEKRIGSNAAHYAFWSPSTLQLAYIWMESSVRFHLSVYDVRSGNSSEIASGMIDPEFVEWSPGGDELLYITVEPDGPDAAESGNYTRSLHRRNLTRGTETVTTDIMWARFDGTEPLVATHKVIKGYRRIQNHAGEEIRNFVKAGGELYVNATRSGETVVKRLDLRTGSSTEVLKGHIYTSTDDGLVVRQYGAKGVSYTYIINGSTTPLLAFASNWHMPYQGSAYLVQGGGGYTPNVCDGRSCFIVSHGGSGKALDWQQRPEDGQGNTHLLAIEDGTVVDALSTVTCNKGNTSCHVGYDDYSATCNDPTGGIGNYVSIAYADGTYSLFGHMKSASLQVAINQAVIQGTYVGDQGHTGGAATYNNYHSCGDHVHFARQTAPAPWSQSIPTDFTELPCQLTCASSYLSSNVEIPAPGAGTLTVVLAPATMIAPNTSIANRIILPSPAPAGGAVVALTSSNFVVTVPASVTVPAGATSAVFSLSANAVPAATTASIQAQYNSATATATVTVNPITLLNLVLPVSSVVGGNPVNGTEVQLTSTSAANYSVSIGSSNTTVVSTPSSVVVPAGSSLATFNASTTAVTSATPVSISATDGISVRSGTLTVNPPALLSIALSPTSVVNAKSSTVTVRLTGPAPVGGVLISLSSSNTTIFPVPASLPIAAGATTGSVVVTAGWVSASTPVTVGAAYAGVNKTAVLTVTPTALSAISLAPASVVNGKNSTVTVTLNGPAAAGGVLVSLSSSDPTIFPVPANVTVAADATTGSVAVTAG
jgi:murein DD-endopeptidase MepM/ murein hydrolase activator NlpD